MTMMTQIWKDGNDDVNNDDNDAGDENENVKYAKVAMTTMSMMTQVWKDGNNDDNYNDNNNDSDKN